jgi:hypothetical protein
MTPRPTWIVALLAALASAPAGVEGQLAEQVAESRRFEQAAMQAARDGDHAAYLASIREAAALRPHHPYLVYRLADALVLTGDASGALAALERVAEMGIAVSPGQEPDFAPLRGRPDFDAVLRRFERNATPVGRAEKAFRIAEDAFLPEGLAHDPRDGTFYVASVHRRLVARVRGDGSHELLAVDPVLSPMGMVFDGARGLLWVAASAVAEGADADSTRLGTAALLALDPGTGRRVGTWSAPEDGNPHLFGDLALGPDGSLVVSDSRTPGVYRLAGPEDDLRAVRLSQPLLSPQGVAFTEEGDAVFLADYALGVVRIDLATGAVAGLDTPPDRTLLGLDGLYRVGSRTLVGVQNGVAPTRVVRLALAPGGRSVEDVTTLEAAHPLHDDPTLGVVVGDDFYYVANGQWAKFADDADADTPVTKPTILRLELRGGAGDGMLYEEGGGP